MAGSSASAITDFCISVKHGVVCLWVEAILNKAFISVNARLTHSQLRGHLVEFTRVNCVEDVVHWDLLRRDGSGRCYNW